MQRPTHIFKIVVNPTFHVHHCAVYQDQESRGLFGFHYYRECPDCRVEPTGYEFWGENGHKQGCASNDRFELARRLRYLAGKQWRMKSGGIMGHRIVKGQPIYYQAH